MEKADKIEISNLINGLKEMDKFNNSLNLPYVDEKVLDFATKAHEDFLKNKEEIMKTIKENIGLFVDLNNIDVGACFGDQYSVRNGNPATIEIGNDIKIRCKLIDMGIVMCNPFNGKFSASDVEILDVFCHPLKSEDPDYTICSATKLESTDYVNCLNLARCVNEWNNIYKYSTWTRAYNWVLVRRFKEMISNKIAALRTCANERSKIRTNLNAVETYSKVSF